MAPNVAAARVPEPGKSTTWTGNYCVLLLHSVRRKNTPFCSSFILSVDRKLLFAPPSLRLWTENSCVLLLPSVFRLGLFCAPPSFCLWTGNSFSLVHPLVLRLESSLCSFYLLSANSKLLFTHPSSFKWTGKHSVLFPSSVC